MKIEIFQGARSGASGPAGQAEPYSDEATAFSRKAVLQREVELEMESLDKTGNFIGYMFVPQVRNSFSRIFRTALVEQFKN